MSADQSQTDQVLAEIRGAVGLITLNRPKALNALSEAMCIAVGDILGAWAGDARVAGVVIRGAGGRAFCAGGDVRAVYDELQAMRRGENDGRLIRELFQREYRMDRRVKTFPKPYVALIDGITMGGGIGISIHGSHRVATERTLAAMPETGIGLFPDVGTSYAFPRLSGETGTWLALSGARLKAADLLHAGIATHVVSSDRLDALVEDLIAADFRGNATAAIETVLSFYRIDPGPADLPARQALIDRCFAFDRVETILAALDGERDPFAAETAKTIRAMSPLSLKITLKEMRRGRTMEFDDCMKMDYRLVRSVVMGHDFSEGIRAVLVDKDHAPKWNPSTLDAVDDSTLDRYFTAPPEGDLIFSGD